jgi:hypothetical protein
MSVTSLLVLCVGAGLVHTLRTRLVEQIRPSEAEKHLASRNLKLIVVIFEFVRSVLYSKKDQRSQKSAEDTTSQSIVKLML